MARKPVLWALLFGLLAPALPCALAPSARAEEESRPNAEKVIASLQKKYEAIESLRASFEQKNELKTLGRTTLSSGRLLLRKPGRLRVEYRKPE